MMTREELEYNLKAIADNAAGDLAGTNDLEYFDELRSKILSAFDSLRAELARVTASLPKTRDGVTVEDGMQVFWSGWPGCVTVYPATYRFTYHHGYLPVDADGLYRYHPETGLSPEGDPKPKPKEAPDAS